MQRTACATAAEALQIHAKMGATMLYFELLEHRNLLNAGTLDVSFGRLGVLATKFQLGIADIQAMAVQKDGRVVAVGHSGLTDSTFALARYTSNGVLDATFGERGLVTLGLGSRNNGAATAIAIQEDSKIVVAGTTGGTDAKDFALARYLSSGRLDATFGIEGKVVTDLGGNDELTSIAITADGSIIVAGSYHGPGVAADGAFVVAKYTSSGLLNSQFGEGGKVTTTFGLTNAGINKILVQDNGAIVAAGHSSTSGTNFSLALARYTSGGALDANFGNGGVVQTPIGKFDDIRDLAQQVDGKLVAVGSSEVNNKVQVVMARYTTAGQLDESFGQAGKVITDLGGLDQAAQSVLVQDDGKLVIAGIYAPRGPSEFFLARYSTTGQFDRDFGTDGWTHTLVSPNFGSGANSVALLPSGKFLAAGGNGIDFALTRYWGDDSPPGFALGSPNSIYIATLYREILGRDVDQPGLGYWLGKLNAGAARSDIARSMTAGGEYLGRQVDGLYGEILGRQADPSGRGFFVSALGSGATLDNIRTILLGSDEFFQKSGGTNVTYLTAVYGTLLGRGLDAGAATFWQGLLAGRGRAPVLAQIMGAQEARLHAIDQLYEIVLNRPADAGRQFWLGVLEQGRREEDIFAALAGSDEYFANL